MCIKGADLKIHLEFIETAFFYSTINARWDRNYWDVRFCVVAAELEENDEELTHILAHKLFFALAFVRVSSLQPQHSLNCYDVINVTHMAQNKHQ